jgi:hypothetical protein
MKVKNVNTLSPYRQNVFNNMVANYPNGRLPDGTLITQEWIEANYPETAAPITSNIGLKDVFRATDDAFGLGALPNSASTVASAAGASPATAEKVGDTIGLGVDPLGTTIRSTATGDPIDLPVPAAGNLGLPGGPTGGVDGNGTADRNYETNPEYRTPEQLGQEKANEVQNAQPDPDAPKTETTTAAVTDGGIDDSMAVKGVKAGLEQASAKSDAMNKQYSDELEASLASGVFGPDTAARDVLTGKGTPYEGTTASDYYSRGALDDLQGKSYSAKYFEGDGPSSLRDVYAREGARQQEQAARRLSAMGKGRSGALVRGSREIDSRIADQLELATANAAKNADASETARYGSIKNLTTGIDTSRSYLGQNMSDLTGKDQDSAVKKLGLRAGQAPVEATNAKSMRDVYAAPAERLNAAREQAISIARGVPSDMSTLMAQLDSSVSSEELAMYKDELNGMRAGTAEEQAFYRALLQTAGGSMNNAAAMYAFYKNKQPDTTPAAKTK